MKNIEEARAKAAKLIELTDRLVDPNDPAHQDLVANGKTPEQLKAFREQVRANIRNGLAKWATNTNVPPPAATVPPGGGGLDVALLGPEQPTEGWASNLGRAGLRLAPGLATGVGAALAGMTGGASLAVGVGSGVAMDLLSREATDPRTLDQKLADPRNVRNNPIAPLADAAVGMVEAPIATIAGAFGDPAGALERPGDTLEGLLPLLPAVGPVARRAGVLLENRSTPGVRAEFVPARAADAAYNRAAGTARVDQIKSTLKMSSADRPGSVGMSKLAAAEGQAKLDRLALEKEQRDAASKGASLDSIENNRRKHLHQKIAHEEKVRARETERLKREVAESEARQGDPELIEDVGLSQRIDEQRKAVVEERLIAERKAPYIKAALDKMEIVREAIEKQADLSVSTRVQAIDRLNKIVEQIKSGDEKLITKILEKPALPEERPPAPFEEPDIVDFTDAPVLPNLKPERAAPVPPTAEPIPDVQWSDGVAASEQPKPIVNTQTRVNSSAANSIDVEAPAGVRVPLEAAGTRPQRKTPKPERPNQVRDHNKRVTEVNPTQSEVTSARDWLKNNRPPLYKVTNNELLDRVEQARKEAVDNPPPPPRNDLPSVPAFPMYDPGTPVGERSIRNDLSFTTNKGHPLEGVAKAGRTGFENAADWVEKDALPKLLDGVDEAVRNVTLDAKGQVGAGGPASVALDRLRAMWSDHKPNGSTSFEQWLTDRAASDSLELTYGQRKVLDAGGNATIGIDKIARRLASDIADDKIVKPQLKHIEDSVNKWAGSDKAKAEHAKWIVRSLKRRAYQPVGPLDARASAAAKRMRAGIEKRFGNPLWINSMLYAIEKRPVTKVSTTAQTATAAARLAFRPDTFIEGFAHNMVSSASEAVGGLFKGVREGYKNDPLFKREWDRRMGDMFAQEAGLDPISGRAARYARNAVFSSVAVPDVTFKTLVFANEYGKQMQRFKAKGMTDDQASYHAGLAARDVTLLEMDIIDRWTLPEAATGGWEWLPEELGRPLLQFQGAATKKAQRAWNRLKPSAIADDPASAAKLLAGYAGIGLMLWSNDVSPSILFSNPVPYADQLAGPRAPPAAKAVADLITPGSDLSISAVREHGAQDGPGTKAFSVGPVKWSMRRAEPTLKAAALQSAMNAFPLTPYPAQRKATEKLAGAGSEAARQLVDMRAKTGDKVLEQSGLKHLIGSMIKSIGW